MKTSLPEIDTCEIQKQNVKHDCSKYTLPNLTVIHKIRIDHLGYIDHELMVISETKISYLKDTNSDHSEDIVWLIAIHRSRETTDKN